MICPRCGAGCRCLGYRLPAGRIERMILAGGRIGLGVAWLALGIVAALFIGALVVETVASLG